MDESTEWVESLTAREIQVVDALLAGCSNLEIAVQLTISKRTVESHLESVYRKCQVSSRGQLMAAYIRGDLPFV